MPKYTYRASGSFKWCSQSGNAIFVIVNKLGSGKKINIESLEINPLTTLPSSTEGRYRVYRQTGTNVSAGEPLPVVKLDSNAPNLPSQIKVLKNADVGTLSGDFYRCVVVKQLNPTATTGTKPLSYLASFRPHVLNQPSAKAPFGSIIPRTGLSGLQKITLRENEAITLRPDVQGASLPWIVDVTFTLDYTPRQTYKVSYVYQDLLRTNVDIFTLVNQTGSGRIVTIEDISIYEYGTPETPYFRIVPIGSVDPEAIKAETAKISFYKMDPTNPTISPNVMEIYQDVPFLPLGLPKTAIADGAPAAAVPKGCSYLETRDFIGPVFRTWLSECRTRGLSTSLDDLSFLMTQKHANIVRGMGLSIREGEGIALVSSAETATTYITVSGWQSFQFGITFTIESTCFLRVKIIDKNLQPIEGARVFIKRATDNAELFNGLTDSNGLIETAYDYTGEVEAIVEVRKSSPSQTRYLPVTTPATIKSTGFDVTVQLLVDPIAQ